jgi:hypothetical protein
MRSRYPASSSFSYSFGPGPLTPAIKALVIANIAAFAMSWFVQPIVLLFGLQPVEVVAAVSRLAAVHVHVPARRDLAHPVQHAGALDVGVELERMWGTRFFLKFYFVAGVGAALTTIILSLLPLSFLSAMYTSVTIGASGAIYGVLLAYAMYYPNRPIYMYFFFPIPAKYFVMIMGGISFLLSTGGPGGGVAHLTHLGGLLAGYLYLKGGRVHVMAEIKYRYLKWRINRMRRKFDVYSGGRADDVDRRVH